MNIRTLGVSSATALSAFSQHRFEYFHALEIFQPPGAAQRILEYTASYPEEGRIYGLFDRTERLQGIVRLQQLTRGQTSVLSYAKAPDAPEDISVTGAIKQVLGTYMPHKNLIFEAVVHHKNSAAQKVLWRLGFQICINTKGYFTYRLSLSTRQAA